MKVKSYVNRLSDSLDALEANHSKQVAKQEREGLFEDGGNINEKLKESLLRTSREHYRHTKQIEVLEASVESLKLALKKSEARNRHLKLNLDELQNSQDDAVINASPVAPGLPAPPTTAGHRSGGKHSDVDRTVAKPPLMQMDSKEIAAARTQRSRYFGRLDEAFQVTVASETA
jgi:hypothetical protein